MHGQFVAYLIYSSTPGLRYPLSKWNLYCSQQINPLILHVSASFRLGVVTAKAHRRVGRLDVYTGSRPSVRPSTSLWKTSTGQPTQDWTVNKSSNTMRIFRTTRITGDSEAATGWLDKNKRSKGGPQKLRHAMHHNWRTYGRTISAFNENVAPIINAMCLELALFFSKKLTTFFSRRPQNTR